MTNSRLALEKNEQAEEQQFTAEPTFSSSALAPSTKKPLITYDPAVAGEAMMLVRADKSTVHFSAGVPDLILEYLDGDIHPITSSAATAMPAQQDVKLSSTQQYEQFKLFGQNLTSLVGKEAALAANLILRGEEKDVEDALALIKQKPILLHCPTEAVDPLKRRVKGTPLQIAAMAGDVNLKLEIPDEKDRGMVERLIAAGNLSKEEVTEQLQCITSDDAQRKNAARNQRVLAAIEKFGTGIGEIKADKNMNFVAFKELPEYTALVAQFEADLQPDTKEIITSGYIFDPKVLQQAIKWFEDNVDKHFGDWLSSKTQGFWVNGVAKLQRKLSSRDVQIIKAGIDRLIDDGVLPARLPIDVGDNNFYDAAPRTEVFLTPSYLLDCDPALMVEKLCQAKTAALQVLCNAKTTNCALNIAL
jgi:hypothetical protein